MTRSNIFFDRNTTVFMFAFSIAALLRSGEQVKSTRS